MTCLMESLTRPNPAAGYPPAGSFQFGAKTTGSRERDAQPLLDIAPQAPGPERSTGRVHVLVCDDKGWEREWLRRTLQSQGYEVCGVARDGAEALTLALATFPDVVLTDLRMPRMDGVELTRRLMETLPTPVVALAEPRDGSLVRQALMAGAVGYLIKPFAEDRLRPVIDGAMRAFADRAVAAWKIGGRSATPWGGGSAEEYQRLATAQHLLMRQLRLSEDEALDRLYGLSRDHFESLEEAAEEVVRMGGARCAVRGARSDRGTG
jgi:AmiR/NasT family two-component response regulator